MKMVENQPVLWCVFAESVTSSTRYISKLTLYINATKIKKYALPNSIMNLIPN